jgi:quercetin dioxygenase-like cupin family protein
MTRNPLPPIVRLGSLLLFAFVAGTMSTGRASSAPAQQQATTIVTGSMRTLDNGNLGIRRFEFSAGSRYYWHTHNWAPQVLMTESGKGLVQVRGGPVIELLPNQPFIVPAGIEHWHGAAPTESTVQWNIYDGLGVAGSVTWGAAVTDAEYNAPPVHLSTQAVGLAWQDAIKVAPPSSVEHPRPATPSRQ